MIQPTVENLMAVNPGYWAEKSALMLEMERFSFAGHEYQIEPMQCEAQKRVCKKATQGGWTLIEVIRSLHGQIFGKYPLGTLYCFPTHDEVVEFSKSRFEPLIVQNSSSIGRYITGTDTASLKKIGRSHLYFRGARATVKIEGLKEESSKLRSIPVDRLVCDELDFMNPKLIDIARQRMGHSRVKEEVYLGNPTIPDFGIDAEYQASDQRHRLIKCEKCNEYTCLETEFPECVGIRPDGAGFRKCKKCGAEVFPRFGKWVAKHPDRDVAGWWWSQLQSVYIDPALILKEYTYPPHGNIGEVYNSRLGMAYIAAEDRLTPAMVYNCCGIEPMPAWSRGPCAMGIDVGKVKHVIIGCRLNNKQKELIKVCRVSGWNDIHDLAKKYNVKSCVIDAMPYTDSARKFQREESYEVFLCEYSEHQVQGTAWKLDKGVVKTNRTEIHDQTHRLVTEKDTLLLPRRCDEVEEFARQVCATAKVLETNERTGGQIYRYRKLDDDDYRHALNYFDLACERISPIPSQWRQGSQQEVAESEYVVLG